MMMTGPGPDGRTSDVQVQLQRQLEQVRERLVRDAERANLPVAPVKDLIDETIAGFETASVRAFLPILVERTVRAAMALPRRTTAGGGTDEQER